MSSPQRSARDLDLNVGNPNTSGYHPVSQNEGESGVFSGANSAGNQFSGAASPNGDIPGARKEDEEEEHDPVSATIAAGKAVQLLMLRETAGTYEVARGSVYGIALAMPQIARCTGWSRTFTGLAIRSYVNLVVNLLIQGVVLYQIDTELNVMNYYGGQMHLCTFGRNFDSCEDGGTDCKGPNGSQYTPSRLYANYQTWSTRMFVQQSLLAIFPDNKDQILSDVDPGEYGLESTLCRCACLFLFVLAIVSDLRETIALFIMLWNIPAEGPKTMQWLSYEPPSWTSDKKHAKDMFGHSELDYVKFSVGGMPIPWKVVNVLCICLPKFLIWLMLSLIGTQFLMETAGICDLIVNCLAITFILDIDELVADRLCTEATKAIMEKLEGWDQFDIGPLEEKSDHEVIHEFTKNEATYQLTDSKLLLLLTPKRLIITCLIFLALYFAYFVRFCEQQEDGSMVSTVLWPPKMGASGNWNPFRELIAPWTVARVDDPSWSFPDDSD